MCGGLTVLAFVLRAPTFVTRLFDPDEAAIGVQAMVVRAGGTLYTDIYDRKPPLPPLLYAASFSVTDSTDIRLDAGVRHRAAWPRAGILVALRLPAPVGPAARMVGGVLMIAGAMALFPADAGAANYAHFALLPGTAAIVLVASRHAADGRRRRRGDRAGDPQPAELAARRGAGVRQRRPARSLAQRRAVPGGSGRSRSPRRASTPRSAGSGNGT